MAAQDCVKIDPHVNPNSRSSRAGLTRASIFFVNEMDHRVSALCAGPVMTTRKNG
jgi:hypothetical protein